MQTPYDGAKRTSSLKKKKIDDREKNIVSDVVSACNIIFYNLLQMKRSIHLQTVIYSKLSM